MHLNETFTKLSELPVGATLSEEELLDFEVGAAGISNPPSFSSAGC